MWRVAIQANLKIPKSEKSQNPNKKSIFSEFTSLWWVIRLHFDVYRFFKTSWRVGKMKLKNPSWLQRNFKLSSLNFICSRCNQASSVWNWVFFIAILTLDGNFSKLRKPQWRIFEKMEKKLTNSSPKSKFTWNSPWYQHKSSKLTIFHQHFGATCDYPKKKMRAEKKSRKNLSQRKKNFPSKSQNAQDDFVGLLRWGSPKLCINFET